MSAIATTKTNRNKCAAEHRSKCCSGVHCTVVSQVANIKRICVDNGN